MKTNVLSFHPIPPNFSQFSLLQKIAYLLAVGFGTGQLPAAGTWGTLFAWTIHTFLAPKLFTLEYWWIGIPVLVFVVLIGIWSAGIVESLTGVKDDSRVNIDEVAGYCVTVLFIPSGWIYTASAFFLFRLFDIIKPPPANLCEKIRGGVGIMLDDLAAGVYACLVLHGFIQLVDIIF